MNKTDFIKNNNIYNINSYNTIIRVIGLGGAGNNTINHLMKKKIKELHTLAVNTDAQHLIDTDSDKKVLIGRNITAGLGAGGDPELGERAAEESKHNIMKAIDGTDLLFITCGLGGGTGTGSAPLIAKLAKEEGILTVAVVTMPLSEEGIIRWENAKIGLEKLKKHVDTLVLLENNKLLELYPDYPLEKALHASDAILINALEGLSDMITKRGIVNLDFADISMVMKDGPNAFIGFGQSDSENRTKEAVQRAINHPMMMKKSIAGAQSALIHISGGLDMKIKETREIIKFIGDELDTNARLIWGASIQKSLQQNIRVMIIVSGLQEKIQLDTPIEHTEENILERDNSVEEIKQHDNIFDIKDSIMDSTKNSSADHNKSVKIKQTGSIFYNIFKEEATGDLKRYERSLQFLREDPKNRRALIDARQACKLLNASAQMFGFDEISQLLSAVENILAYVQSREMKLTKKIISSLTLAMEMVVDLMENKTDGLGETGYIVDRLKELKGEQINTYK